MELCLRCLATLPLLSDQLDSIQLMVWKKNSSAIAFYEKHGFSAPIRRMMINRMMIEPQDD
jgi:ribosomal protein S18 acetylase RimI-like enzyme